MITEVVAEGVTIMEVTMITAAITIMVGITIMVDWVDIITTEGGVVEVEAAIVEVAAAHGTAVVTAMEEDISEFHFDVAKNIGIQNFLVPADMVALD